MKDAQYLFAEWLTLMARWLAIGADRDRITGRVEADKRAGRHPSKQSALDLADVQKRMDTLEAKLKLVQAAREDLAASGSGLSIHA